jgi:hypothetical protein
MVSIVLIFGVALNLAAAATEAWATKPDSEIPFSKAKIIIEFNSTANGGVGDVGVQVLLDGEPWRLLKIKSPNGREILHIIASSSLRKQGLTELFFEEGTYEFEGKTIEGQEIEGKATFTHVIPAGPVIVSPPLNAEVDPKNLVISWKAVTKDIAGRDSVIVAYQIIVERTDNDQLGAALRTFDIKLPATSQSVTVPAEFLEPGTEYKFEVLAIEAGGNQTISEGGPFRTQ